MRVVIIGNGVAGIEAALAVRARQEDWEITIVSEESEHFFSRTALMYVFCGQMSHGNIEPYCEMGIDVRAYAQNNQSFKRASCVGCGMCAHVCPRGVLKLESKWDLAGDKARQRLRVLDL